MEKLLWMKTHGTTQVFTLHWIVTYIGRASSNQVVVDEAEVSRTHALLVRDGTQTVIHDLSSRNGVFVNGARVHNHPLGNGDLIALGSSLLRFASESSLHAVGHRRPAGTMAEEGFRVA